MLAPLGNTDGKPVDWWFIYKLPIDIGPGGKTTGFEYLYLDSGSGGRLSLSPVNMDKKETAIGHTLGQLEHGDPDTGYILWNDEIPPAPGHPDPKNKGNLGHSKGVLAFNRKEDTAFYLLHSTPRFPRVGEVTLPEDERKFGQTYLCIRLKDYQTANRIAGVLHAQNEVQVYDSRLPGVTREEPLYRLGEKVPVVPAEKPAILDFESAAGHKFKLIAKNKHWSKPKKSEKAGRDFWKDLVGPTLRCNIDVETWRRGTVFGDLDTGVPDKTLDIVDVDLTPLGFRGYRWPYSKDHSKWGVSCGDTRYVIIADINRQVSQQMRGGGGIAFQHPKLWEVLTKICIPEKKVEAGIHKDQA